MQFDKIYSIIDFVVGKKESEIILRNRLKYCTKELFRLLTLILVAFFIITLIVFIKYNPLYEVKLNGEVIGYVKNKEVMEEMINSKVLTSDNPCAVFTTLDVEPTYELKLSNRNLTDEEEVLNILSQNATTTYRVYAITINNETKTYVNTLEEAESIVEEMKNEYSEDVATIGISEQYTQNLEEVGTVELAVARASVNTDLEEIQEEQEKIEQSTFHGVYFSVRPIEGRITSRYGAVESIRDHTHAGIDIAAPRGTDIKAAADGTVSYSGWMSGYGYLIIIDHANGVESYYGHCSKLYADVGDEVTAGDVIAAVGSTGNSTGNHLHFEIRLNGSTINPESYIF